MKKISTLASDLLILLQALLLVLFVFHRQLAVPVPLMLAGHLHPLLVHFPIALVFLLLPAWWGRSLFPDREFHGKLFDSLLVITTFFSTLSALSGLLLASGGDYDPDLTGWHRLAGCMTAFLNYSILLAYRYGGAKKVMVNTGVIVTILALITGSHFGAMLTHGENYLSLQEQNVPARKHVPVTDSTAVFQAAIVPVLESRCYGCHSKEKAKGGLVLTDTSRILKGGKSGALFVTGDPAQSTLIRRLLLPPEEKKHMPPKGKPQLTLNEISLLEGWIARGAGFHRSFRDFPVNDSFRILASALSQAADLVQPEERQFDFKVADDRDISRLNTPFRTITPWSNRSPALHVSFFIRQAFTAERIDELSPVKKQVVSMNLAHMPVKDEDLARIATFPNLEKLNLNGTDITGTGLTQLQACSKLSSLSLANTAVDQKSLEKIAGMASLKEVFIWQTGVTETNSKQLRTKYNKVRWDLGYQPDSSEMLTLTPPQLATPGQTIYRESDSVRLEHPLRGVSMIYTLDGSDPDSLKPLVYREPLPAKGPMVIRTKAMMPGWKSSPTSEFQVFNKGLTPAGVNLAFLPDAKYTAAGSASLFDEEKGEAGNTVINWLGFRDKPCIAICRFDKPVRLTELVVSMAENHGAYIFPPSRITVLGGPDSTRLSAIGSLVPDQPKAYGPVKIKAYSVKLSGKPCQWIRVEIHPLLKLPGWHGGKGQKGWIFIDEVFLKCP